MENLLRSIAQKLIHLDEASLSRLWDIYYQKTKHFMPTQEWEIDFLVFTLIQAIKWKNRVFNLQLQQGAFPNQQNPANQSKKDFLKSGIRPKRKKRAKIISFPTTEKS